MIDLRKELNVILNFDKEYNFIIVRHKTENKCICWRQASLSPDPTCSNCEGGGWLFDEWIAKCKYFNATTFKPVAHLTDFNYGQTYHQNFVVYLESTEKNLDIQLGDLLFEIASDRNGRVIDPIKRLRKWHIVDFINMKLDSNKSEFIKIFANPVSA